MSLSRRSKVLPRWFAVGLLMLVFALALTSAIQKSPTMDEQNHIARGAAYLGTGDPRLSVEHPPLINVVSALAPHLLLDLQLPLDQWWDVGEWYHFADNFLWGVNQHPDRIVFLARLPIIGLGMLLVALVFRWATSLFGSWGGLLAAVFCALDPNLLAHARLSTTDVGGTFFSFLAAYVFWCRLRNPSFVGVVVTGLTLGLAFTAKLSALIFGPLLTVAFALDGFVARSRSRRLSHQVAALAGVAALSVLVIWSSYGFEVGPVHGVGGCVPAWPFVEGVRAVLGLAGGGRPSYLLGQISTEGWWYYFPVAFAVKTPLPTLLALVAATGVMTRSPTRDDLFILVPSLLFFLVSMVTRLNLGYRHLLPMLPFLAVHIGRLADPGLYSRKRLSFCLSFAAAVWLTISTLSIHPHFLAFFNPLGGGPSNGWRILVDSNIDWGQDLKGLRTWMLRHNVDSVRLSWFGSARPDAYDIPHELLPGVPYGFDDWEDPAFDSENPEPGVYAISVSNLVGVALPNHDLYAWFRRREPSAKVGYSVFIYRVAERD